jgi:anti-sigma factor (TIGR02949 family)
MALVHDYLKRELTPDLLLEIGGHLEHCRDCADHAEFEERFLRMLETRARKETCPKEVRARILAALRAAAKGS